MKRRIIPLQLLLDGRLVKSIEFGELRDVGDPVKSSGVYSSQNADELILLNVSRTDRSIAPLLPLMEAISKVCFMPLAVGGGVNTLDDAATLIREGADKVVINSAAYRRPELIRDVAQAFGNQAVVLAVDVRRGEDGHPRPYSRCGTVEEPVTLDAHLDRCVPEGVGEVLIQSIDRDGRMIGYDLDLLNSVQQRVAVPVIIAGGSGDYAHLRDALTQTHVSAVACGSLFNFSDSNPMRAKAYLSNYGIAFKKI